VFENYDLAVGEFRLYVMDADGSNVRQIPSAAGSNFWPEWSPDGTRILFLSSRPPRGWWTMYIVNADGTGERQLSDDSACLSHISLPKWTPDGSRLLIPPRTGNRSYEYAPVWSPDGSQVAFASDRDTPEHLSQAAWHIFVANASGGSITRITSDSAGYHVTDWGPPR
jgi:Tol biopolymer transport system component